MSDQTDNRKELIRELTEARKQISTLEERETELIQLLGEDLSAPSYLRLILVYWGPSGVIMWVPGLGNLSELFNAYVAYANQEPLAVGDTCLSLLKNIVHPEDLHALEIDIRAFFSGVVDSFVRRHRLQVLGEATMWAESYALATRKNERQIPIEFLACIRLKGRSRGSGPIIDQVMSRLDNFWDSLSEEDSPSASHSKSHAKASGDSLKDYVNKLWLMAAVAQAEGARLWKSCVLSFVKDRSMKYVWVSDPFAEKFGLSPQEFRRRSDAKIFHTVEERVEENTGEAVIRRVTRNVRRTRIVDGAPQVFQDTLWTVPLSNIDQARWIVGVSWPVDTDEIVSETWRSPSTLKVLEEVHKAAKSDSIVLLTGESGSGKDYFARYIHEHSQRENGPYFPINCAAIPVETAESEIFGHEKGAFTGAHARKRGLLELAEGGTLLLNEIGELSQRLQAKLLTFLDTNRFTRVGGEKEISVNARLLAATNRDVEEEVRQGRFRKDLFYRLNVIRIEIPPLRDRQEDLPYIAKRLLDILRSKMGLEWVPTIDQGDINALKAYFWPGNIRELRNVLERALLSSTSGPLSLREFLPERSSADTALNHIPWKIGVEFPRSDQGLADVVSHVKMQLIEEALRRTGGNQKKAAQLLGIDRHTVGDKSRKR